MVADSLTTSFHAPGPRLYANPNYTSYVQHRGSIPLYWMQDNNGVTPKPPIELNMVDPFYSAAALHFDDLFQRYGAPIYVLNLVKTRERTPRESKLLAEFTIAIKYLNQFLPADKKILHKAWDMSRASKNRHEDVIGTLEGIAEEVLQTTGFFRNGDGQHVKTRTQNGVARTNCIDCLDRTNAAQFVIGKRALGLQLHALGIISPNSNSLEYDTDAVNLFTHMYHDHGDTIAVQYGGSHLVNTMETYRKINQWTSHSRDMVESFKRYYNNSFLDGQRQEAYNLFLGNYIWTQGQPMLWDLTTDYYLHHANPRAWLEKNKKRRSYIDWYTPEHLEPRVMEEPVAEDPNADHLLLRNLHHPLSYYDNYWSEYYKPRALSSFEKIFMFKINSTIKYTPTRSSHEGRYDLSPFKVRTELDQDIPEKAVGGGSYRKKGVTIVDPNDEVSQLSDTESIKSNRTTATQSKGTRIGIQRWLQPIHEKTPHGIMKEANYLPQEQKLSKPLDKSKAAQWTFTQVIHESLNPSVTHQDTTDYETYLRIENDRHAIEVNEYEAYVGGQWVAGTGTGQGDRYWGGYGREGGDTGIGIGMGTAAMTGGHVQGVGEEDLAEFVGFLELGRVENPLDVREEDKAKKRYKAYRKWLRGKNLFKQQPVE